MSGNRLNPVSGGTYFFTVRLRDPRSDLLVSQIDLLRDAARVCRKRWPFTIDAAVILPSQLHMIWTLPEGDSDFALRWRQIKAGFSRHVSGPSDRTRRGNAGIWQRGYWHHHIQGADDLALHMHLIRSAPIHAGLVKKPSDWPYSSLHRDMAKRVRTIAPAPLAQDPKVAAIAS